MCSQSRRYLVGRGGLGSGPTHPARGRLGSRRAQGLQPRRHIGAGRHSRRPGRPGCTRRPRWPCLRGRRRWHGWNRDLQRRRSGRLGLGTPSSSRRRSWSGEIFLRSVDRRRRGTHGFGPSHGLSRTLARRRCHGTRRLAPSSASGRLSRCAFRPILRRRVRVCGFSRFSVRCGLRGRLSDPLLHARRTRRLATVSPPGRMPPLSSCSRFRYFISRAAVITCSSILSCARLNCTSQSFA